MKLRLFLVMSLAVCIASRAEALCIYNGTLYAKTTLDQEFHDSSLVVRATVVSQITKVPLNGGPRDPGVLSMLHVEEAFKGTAPEHLSYWTKTNSRAFPLEEGKQYLLFLNPMPSDDPDQDVAQGAFLVNYTCGQSGLWAKISPEDQNHLRQISKRSK